MTQTQSHIIQSNQSGTHDSLDSVVLRHLHSVFKRPFPQYSIEAFEPINELVSAHRGPLIIDSYCGVGESTASIAAAHPSALVIGIDKSSHRLDKHPQAYANSQVDNYRLVRADVDDFWRLAVAANWRPNKHFILYPNPWPKSSQLKRRCHGSPLFPSILALGGKLEVRSNWAIYIEEFAQALTLVGQPCSAEHFQPEPAITPFERKYQLSEQSLWRCRVELQLSHRAL